MQAYFFDMDGVLFDSMPSHAEAWVEVMQRHNLPITYREVFINEGRTGRSVIDECYRNAFGTEAPDGLWQQIYREKGRLFESKGEPATIGGVHEVLRFLKGKGKQIWIVTGSAQQSLFSRLDTCFPDIFSRERMITAYDVEHGKPAPDPYLAAWQRSGIEKGNCAVIENAPLGVRSAKAAGLFCMAVNTGILTLDDLAREHADIVFNDMHELLTFMQVADHIETHILPLYQNFDNGHNLSHAHAVMNASLQLASALRLYAATDGDSIKGFCCPVGGTRAALLAYTIAAYHDIGLSVDREHHHLNSGKMLRADLQLRHWFTDDEIELMACAAEDHRASATSKPRTVFGAIVADADRDLNVTTVIRRALQYGIDRYPELSDDEHCRRAADHLQDKYSASGYMHLWLNDPQQTLQQQQLQLLISNPIELLKTTQQVMTSLKHATLKH